MPQDIQPLGHFEDNLTKRDYILFYKITRVLHTLISDELRFLSEYREMAAIMKTQKTLGSWLFYKTSG